MITAKNITGTSFEPTQKRITTNFHGSITKEKKRKENLHVRHHNDVARGSLLSKVAGLFMLLTFEEVNVCCEVWI